MSKSNRNVGAHPPVLSDAARMYAKKVRGNRKLAIKFSRKRALSKSQVFSPARIVNALTQ